MKTGQSMTVNNITVVIHRITPATVYFARFHDRERDCDYWFERPLYQMPRADFERQWTHGVLLRCRPALDKIDDGAALAAMDVNG